MQLWHVPCRESVSLSNQGMKMYRKLMWAAAAVLALVPFEAQATTLAFSFGTADAQFSVSGDATGISGTASGSNGGAITDLETNPSEPAAYNDGSWDNVVFPSGPWLDDNLGVLFTAGGYGYNLYSEGWSYYLSSFNPARNYNPGEVGHSADATIPEPATWLMVALGFAALGAAGSRSSRRDRWAAFA
jgi:PEP-CTERM motif